MTAVDNLPPEPIMDPASEEVEPFFEEPHHGLPVSDPLEGLQEPCAVEEVAKGDDTEEPPPGPEDAFRESCEVKEVRMPQREGMPPPQPAPDSSTERVSTRKTSGPAAEVSRGDSRIRQFIYGVLTFGFAFLAPILVVLPFLSLLDIALKTTPLFARVIWGAVAILVALVLAEVFLEWRTYKKLRDLSRLRSAFKALEEHPREPELNKQAYAEARAYLKDFQEEANDPNIPAAIRTVERRTEGKDGEAKILRDQIEEFILGPMDKRAEELTYKAALNVAIGTAIITTRWLNSIIVLSRNVNLVASIAETYKARPGPVGNAVLFCRVWSSVLLADLTEQVADAILGKGISPMARGICNGAMTIRLGIKARQECRPFPASEKGQNMWRLILDRVKKRLASAASEAIVEYLPWAGN